MAFFVFALIPTSMRTTGKTGEDGGRQRNCIYSLGILPVILPVLPVVQSLVGIGEKYRVTFRYLPPDVGRFSGRTLNETMNVA